MTPRAMTAALLALAGNSAWASSFDLNSLENLSQSQFQALSEDLGAALSYKPLEPAAPLGVTGFDIGAALEGTSLANTQAVQTAVGSSSVYGTLPVPSIRAVKGLPYNVDVGAEYARIPGSGNMSLYGAELKWAFLPGDMFLPSVALRASVTRIDGVPQLGFESYGADISISKGFLMVTPYGGIGEVRSRSATDGLSLQQVNINQTKVFAGADFNLGLANLVFEADSTGNIKSYGAKIGFRF
jgi:hypothetical protein